MTLAAVGRGWGGPTYKRPVICSSGRQLSYHASHAQGLRVLAVHGISVRVSINTAVFSSVKTRDLRSDSKLVSPVLEALVSLLSVFFLFALQPFQLISSACFSYCLCQARLSSSYREASLGNTALDTCAEAVQRLRG